MPGCLLRALLPAEALLLSRLRQRDLEAGHGAALQDDVDVDAFLRGPAPHAPHHTRPEVLAVRANVHAISKKLSGHR